MSEYPGREALEEKWRSFAGYKGKPVTGGTITYYAKEYGWIPPKEGSSEEVVLFKFLTLDELFKNMTPTRWLVKNYLEQHTMGLMFGDPGCGKSLIAIDMACCIATGTPWHGNDAEQGAVFYIAGEGHNGLARRFLAWQAQNKVLLGEAPLLTSERAAQFYNHESAQAVIDAIHDLKRKSGFTPRLIIIDTLARNFGGGDENSTQDMNIFIQHVDALKDRYKATVLIVHHSGHADKGRARGAMSLKGALDHEYKIQKDESENVTLTCTKTKDGPDPAPLNFKIVSMLLEGLEGEDTNGGTISYMGSGWKPKDKPLSKQKQAALDILSTLLDTKGVKMMMQGAGLVTVAQLEEYKEALKQGGISDADKPDSVRTAITRAIKNLEKINIIETYKDYVWIADMPDKSGHFDFDDLTETDRQDTPL